MSDGMVGVDNPPRRTLQGNHVEGAFTPRRRYGGHSCPPSFHQRPSETPRRGISTFTPAFQHVHPQNECGGATLLLLGVNKSNNHQPNSECGELMR